MKFFKEFNDFANKGNLIELSVAFVMGVSFTKVTNAFIQGMVMPLIGMIQGQDMMDWKWIILKAGVDEKGNLVKEVSIKYGDFLGALLEFIIIAFFMFLVVKAINKIKRRNKKEVIEIKSNKQEELLTEIRDLMKEERNN